MRFDRSERNTYRSYLGILGALLVCASFTSHVFAVDALGIFELDGDATDDAAAGDDWETLFNGGGGSIAFTGVTPDEAPLSIFTGGRKDIQDIDQWSHKDGAVPDKGDITNAYAAAYLHNGELIIYFGADRYSNVGDTFMGFWFFQNNVAAVGGGDFTGLHMNGDILVLVNFPQAENAVPMIQVVEWDDSCDKADSNDPMDGDCAAKNLRLKYTGMGAAGAICNGGGMMACAITNVDENNPVPSPWPYVSKDGFIDAFPFETFFEGGINVTQLFPDSPPCFTSFLAETRSSSSFTASLKDFVIDEFPVCSISATTTCLDGEVNSTGDGFITTREVTVSNDGVGSVMAPTIQETISDIVSVCEITSVNGNLLGAPVALPAGVDVAVPGVTEIAGGDTVTVGLTCASDANTFTNEVIAKADIGTQMLKAMASDDATTSDCSVVVAPELEVEKTCTDVRLMAMEGVLVVEVVVDIKVTNKSIEQVNLVDLRDDPAGIIIEENVDPPILLAASGLAGDSVTYEVSYLPSAPDQAETEPGKYDPGTAMFTDTATATVVGVLSRERVSASGSVTCDLCPSDG